VSFLPPPQHAAPRTAGLPRAGRPLDRTQLFHPANVAAYRTGVEQAVGTLARRLERQAGPATGRSPGEASALVGDVDLDRPLGDLGDALAELDRVWLEDAVWFHEPTYAAHLNCPVVVPAVIADTLTAAVNTSMDTFDQSVGATFVERELVAWTAGRVGWETGADGIFTSGGTHSNLQGLLLARDTARERGVDLADMRVACSADAHFSVHTGARLLGLPDGCVVPVPVDGRRRLDPAALEGVLLDVRRSGAVPVAVVATAGTTDFGAIDPLPEVASAARRHDAWLHVDAAYGGGLLVSRRHRGRLEGIELADSVTVDYHKTWFQPVACSALLVREAADLRHVAWHADYLNPREGTNPNQVDKSIQTTRRFDALKPWLTLRVMGADLLGDHLDAVIDLTRDVHRVLDEEYADVELAARPELTTLVFRCLPAESVDEEAVGALNRAVREHLYRSGRAMVAATRVNGRQFLKLTLLNPMAAVDDVLGIVDAACAAARELAPVATTAGVPR